LRNRSVSGLDKSSRKGKSARHVNFNAKDRFMKHVVHLMIIGAFVLSFSAVGYAQMQATPPAAPTTPAAPAAPQAKKAPMSAKSKECSEKATAQGLHGKARKEFREKCKKGET
jgi:hypothetical protein